MKTSFTRLATAATVATLLAFGLSGCNGLLHPDDYPTDGPTLKALSNPAEITAKQFGHSWGLTVDHGTVGCTFNSDGDPILIFTEPNGTVYALNSVKENSDKPDIGKIANGSIGPLRTFAFTVCDEK